jgi:hypothetical protein
MPGGFSFPPADNVPRYMDAPLAPVDRLRSWVGWNGEKVDPLFGPPSYVLRFDYDGRIVYTDLWNGWETAILLQEDNAMTAGPWTVYDNAVLGITEGLFNLNTNKFAMILMGQAYMPTVATDTKYSDISAFELPTANGYTVGGVIIPQTSEVLVADAVTLSGSAATWANFSAQFRWAVIVRQAGNSLAPTDLLLCYSDCTGASALSQGAGPLTIMADPTPIITFTHQP